MGKNGGYCRTRKVMVKRADKAMWEVNTSLVTEFSDLFYVTVRICVEVRYPSQVYDYLSPKS